jgi:hypothetical protein
MNSINQKSAEQHQEMQLLLPWYLNQSLDEHEQQAVESHLRNCIQCKMELLDLRKLSSELNRTSDWKADMEISFAEVRTKMKPKSLAKQKLGAIGGSSRVVGRHKRKFLYSAWSKLAGHKFYKSLDTDNGLGKPLAIAASLLLVLIPLALKSWDTSSTNDYYTLSAKTPVSASRSQLHVVFAKSVTSADIDALLAQIHARRLDGPNSVGAYLVQIDNLAASQSLINAIDFLRRQQLVLLAEPAMQ